MVKIIIKRDENEKNTNPLHAGDQEPGKHFSFRFEQNKAASCFNF
jgi:hypothetical protein